MFNLDNVMKLLNAIANDHLDIRRYQRLVSHIVLPREEPKGAVLFSSTRPTECSKKESHQYYSENEVTNRASSHACLQHRLDFSLDESVCISKVPEPATTLLHLPHQISRQIFDYVLMSSGKIPLDMKTRDHRLPGLPFLTRAIHQREYKRYCTLNSFTLRTIHEYQRPRIFDFDALNS